MTGAAQRPRLLIVTGIFPPDHGGPATYVPAIAAALSASFEIVAVVTGSERTDHDDTRHPFPVIRIARSAGRARRLAQTILLLRRLARRADIVYLNGMVLEGIVACKLLRRRPVAVKVVGDRIWEMARNADAADVAIDAFQIHAGRLKWRLLHRLQSWYMARADRVIVPSRYLGAIVAGWGVPEDRIECVYNAVKHAPPEAPPPEPAWDIVAVCRLVPWKGLDALIDVAAQRGWRLKVVGDGPLRDRLLKKIRNLDASGHIEISGEVEQRDVVPLMRRARVFVLNSSYEGLPHVVLEAMSAGTPVVATDVGGTGEVVEDGVTGMLIPDGDDDRLEAAIGTLLDDPSLRQSLAAAALDRLSSQFSFANMLSGTAAVLAATAGK